MVSRSERIVADEDRQLTTPRPRSPEPLAPAGQREPVRPEIPPDEGGVSVFAILNVLLRHRVLIIALGLLGGFYAGMKSITSPSYFKTEAQFMPQGARTQSQLSGLAAQFGITQLGADAGQSPAFYLDLIESRSLLAAVGNRTYETRSDKGIVTGNLIKLFNIKGKNPAVQKANMIGLLKGAVSENAARTGVITLTVQAVAPGIAVQIARNVLDEVNLFNLKRRQAQAGAERSFVEKRLGEAQVELRQAEENLQSFLTENREFRSSPSLQLEFDRLNRTVSMRQGLYNALAQSFEQAKIEEVRDLPVITIIEPPEFPLGPEPRGGPRRTLIGIAVGMAIGVILAFLLHLIAGHREAQSDDFAEFDELKRDALADLTHPWRPIMRPISRLRTSRSPS